MQKLFLRPTRPEWVSGQKRQIHFPAAEGSLIAVRQVYMDSTLSPGLVVGAGEAMPWLLLGISDDAGSEVSSYLAKVLLAPRFLSFEPVNSQHIGVAEISVSADFDQLLVPADFFYLSIEQSSNDLYDLTEVGVGISYDVVRESEVLAIGRRFG